MRKSLTGGTLRNFTFTTGKSAGRNESGRITVFHRGGGSKRLQRKIDLKRSTSSMGIVERIEYDPNRSSRIALVRWPYYMGGVLLRRQKKCNTIEEFAPSNLNIGQILESTTATIFCLFSFSSLPGKVDQRKVACSQAKCLLTLYVVVGLPTFMPPCSKSPFTSKGAGSKQTCAKDVFFSALSSPLAKGETAFLSFGSSLAFPRIAIAGAKPAFFAPRMREKLIGKRTFSLCEIRKLRTHCVLWAHRIKRKAALSWRQQANLGLVGAAEHNESKPKADQGSLPAKLTNRGEGPKNGACKVDRAPVTYILASHQLEAGQMVMNCDWSKPSKSSFLRPTQNSHTYRRFQDRANLHRVEGGSQLPASWPRPPAYRYEILDLNSKVGNCIPLADIRMGTFVHDIEYHPGQGAKLARAAGTYAKIIQEPASQCLVRLPSGVEKLIDSRCRATIGIVSNPHHGARKLRKAGQSRWLGRRPIVRGVAMNPVDHPHGGGEGRTKGGRPSVSPWGKPTKAGFRAVVGVGKRRI
uniref:ribosomal protein L2 n=1 Tax=Apostasia shenzhenica TaxID=1088818 RepID=UPI00279AA8B4|nr:ribosomal protein L2 [Apostasia shenzhenica]WGF19830.1 ribosomal protein L2 [Apostasia shenzhenica]